MPAEDAKITVTPPEAAPLAQEEDEIDFSPFFNYLNGPNGHEIASRVVRLIEDTKKVTIDKSYANAKFNRWMEVSVIIVVVIAIVILSVMDKLNPTVAILLGSIVGYFFGKNK